MTWLAAHAAEVVRGIDQAAAKVMLPDAIDDAAPGERIVFVGDPLGQSRAAGGFMITGDFKRHMKPLA